MNYACRISISVQLAKDASKLKSIQRLKMEMQSIKVRGWSGIEILIAEKVLSTRCLKLTFQQGGTWICHTKIRSLRNGINGETVHSHRTVCSNTQIYIIVTMPNMHYVSLLWDFKNKFSVYSMVKDLSKKTFNPRT